MTPGAARITTGNNILLKEIVLRFLTLAQLMWCRADICQIWSQLKVSKTRLIVGWLMKWHIPCVLGGAKVHFYKHLDVNEVKTIIRQSQKNRFAILTDSVFSMFGEIFPLPDLLEFLDLDRHFLILDEAHSLGVLGRTGKGILEYFDIDATHCGSNLIRTSTFSKALGSYGGVVMSSQ